MEKEIQKRRLEGVVVSDKMQKTIVVKVDSRKTHPKYFKQYTESKRFKVHDEKGTCKTGDKVVFEECKPMSKDKRWRVIYN
jgi:small subunit ribosomal protein S17